MYILYLLLYILYIQHTLSILKDTFYCIFAEVRSMSDLLENLQLIGSASLKCYIRREHINVRSNAYAISGININGELQLIHRA